MANLHAIHSVGLSLIKYLRNAYPAELQQNYPCDFRLVGSSELNGKSADFGTAVTLYLYRVTINQYLRNSQQLNSLQQITTPLSVDLSYLLTFWATDALAEHTILGWAIRQLHMHQTLSQSDLTPDGGWEPGDLVQVIPNEISNEDLMRIWDAVDPGYRLSVSYVARVVRIDANVQPDAQPVVAKSLRFAAGNDR